MNIFVLHGDHTVNSYSRLQEIIKKSKRKGWEIERISGEESLSLPERLTASRLFGGKVLFVIENFGKITSEDFKWLKRENNKLEGFLIIYSRNSIGKKSLSSLPKGYKEEEFSLPKLIWKFLDSVNPKNAKGSISLLHEAVESEPPEFVFALLASRIRDLYWVLLDEKSLPAGPPAGRTGKAGPPYPDWRVGKLKKQAEKFKKEELKQLIHELAEIDIKVKTSKANLIDALDLLIVTHLE